MKTIKKGKIGEKAVEMFLVKRGYTIISRGLRVVQGRQRGEIDILALKNNVLYIIEVKTNFNKEIWDRDEILSNRKIAKLGHLRRLFYLIKHASSTDSNDWPKQIDENEPKLFETEKTSKPAKSAKPITLDLTRVKVIKIVLASVTVSGETIAPTTCNIEFRPII
jgi:Holliday junction resolvase-like predicted endonuclease